MSGRNLFGDEGSPVIRRPADEAERERRLAELQRQIEKCRTADREAVDAMIERTCLRLGVAAPAEWTTESRAAAWARIDAATKIIGQPYEDEATRRLCEAYGLPVPAEWTDASRAEARAAIEGHRRAKVSQNVTRADSGYPQTPRRVT